ncbi:uncharacterized protein [Amphiura filiformis]|uniref:uncharacterized protein n=1 Tax=Amphiura filiformis TaxID=82378 RepID=UPI003B21094C
MEIPLQQSKLIAMFLALCLVQSVFTSPVSPSVRQELLEFLRSKERKYSQQLDTDVVEADDTQNTLHMDTDRLIKRNNGSPLAFSPGLVMLDILRAEMSNNGRRQQMSELAAQNSELFTRVGRR